MMHPGESGAPVLEAYETALRRIRAVVEPVGKERIPVEEACGRIAARELVAPFQVPALPVSTRDGYALRSADTEMAAHQRTAQVKVVGSALPGEPFARPEPLGAGEAVEIRAGALLPAGADAVISAERTSRRANQLHVMERVRSGSGVSFPGDDVHDGTLIVEVGQPLTASQLGLLAATGFSHIGVYRRPRVGLITIEANDPSPHGEEDRRKRLSAGNAVALAAWCTQFGLSARHWRVSDDADEGVAALEEAERVCDAFMVIGAVYPGVRAGGLAALEQMEWDVHLEGVRLRPGRATSFGTLGGKPVFVLPHSPVACETAFLLLALPGLCCMAGTVSPPFPIMPARLSRSLRRMPEQKAWTQVVRVRLAPGTFFLRAEPLTGQAVREQEGRLVAAASANGLLLLDEGIDGPRTGDIVGVILLQDAWS
jgi:molybdopterin molybdotransferase